MCTQYLITSNYIPQKLINRISRLINLFRFRSRRDRLQSSRRSANGQSGARVGRDRDGSERREPASSLLPRQRFRQMGAAPGPDGRPEDKEQRRAAASSESESSRRPAGDRSSRRHERAEAARLPGAVPLLPPAQRRRAHQRARVEGDPDQVQRESEVAVERGESGDQPEVTGGAAGAIVASGETVDFRREGNLEEEFERLA